MEKELETALEAAREAGKIMDGYQQDGFESEEKTSATDLVTEADRSCQQTVVEHLKEEFPEYGIVAEEDNLREEKDAGNWVVDPIDGTLNFSKGFPYYCCSIGLRKNGEYVLGVVLSPESALGRCYYATRGKGSYRARLDKGLQDVEEIRVSENGIEGARVSFDWTDSGSGRRDFSGDQAAELQQQGAAICRPGAAALNLCMAAEGAIDGSIIHVSEWDYAAGTAILEGAGGTVSTSPLENGFTEVVASNGKIQKNLLNIARAQH